MPVYGQNGGTETPQIGLHFQINTRVEITITRKSETADLRQVPVAASKKKNLTGIYFSPDDFLLRLVVCLHVLRISNARRALQRCWCSPESLPPIPIQPCREFGFCAEELAPVATCRPAAIGAQAIFIMLGEGAGEHVR